MTTNEQTVAPARDMHDETDEYVFRRGIEAWSRLPPYAKMLAVYYETEIRKYTLEALNNSMVSIYTRGNDDIGVKCPCIMFEPSVDIPSDKFNGARTVYLEDALNIKTYLKAIVRWVFKERGVQISMGHLITNTFTSSGPVKFSVHNTNQIYVQKLELQKSLREEVVTDIFDTFKKIQHSNVKMQEANKIIEQSKRPNDNNNNNNNQVKKT
jgi:hypothetical protein